MRIASCSLASAALVVLIGVQAAPTQLGGMDLVTALELDLVRAEFRGNGENSVVGTIWGAPDGPQSVTIAPGTRFFAQLGGGVQGMGTIGGGTIGLGGGGLGLGPTGGDRVAHVTIPTACTNIGLRPPTRRDVMVVSRCPDPRVASVAALGGRPGMSQPALQIAIWAIANDPPREPIEKYAAGVAKKAKKAEPEAQITADVLLSQAAEALRRADVDPEQFRMFQ